MILFQVTKKYPIIVDYDGAWPVCAMLKMSLKNSAQHARKRGVKVVRKDKVLKSHSKRDPHSICLFSSTQGTVV